MPDEFTSSTHWQGVAKKKPVGAWPKPVPTPISVARWLGAWKIARFKPKLDWCLNPVSTRHLTLQTISNPILIRYLITCSEGVLRHSWPRHFIFHEYHVARSLTYTQPLTIASSRTSSTGSWTSLLLCVCFLVSRGLHHMVSTSWHAYLQCRYNKIT